jgi:hypothetical protein
MTIPLLVALGLLQTAAAPPPTVSPFFLSRTTETGPSFFVECVNATQAPISTGSRHWPLEVDRLRLDGRTLQPQGNLGPGLVDQVPPGGTWRGIIELRQAKQRTGFAVALGAHVRAGFLVPLAAGRHTIAVRCGDRWSADLVFYFER